MMPLVIAASVASAVLMRGLHVAAMGVLLGGAVLAWAVASGRGVPDGAALAAADRYEWAFWAAVGVVVLTGVGNVGALGEALPAPRSAWGARFSLKLAVVLALLAASVVRTLVVAHLAAAADGARLSARGRAILSGAYAATAVALGAAAALAVVLSHGVGA